jgi:hypothetical protein
MSYFPSAIQDYNICEVVSIGVPTKQTIRFHTPNVRSACDTLLTFI